MTLQHRGAGGVGLPQDIPLYGPEYVMSQRPVPRWNPVIEVTARLGKDAILPCPPPRNGAIKIVIWTLLGLEGCVYRNIDTHSELGCQHDSYEHRTQLNEGGPSLLLKNVSSSDEGTYECRYIEEENPEYSMELENDTLEFQRRLKRATDDIMLVTQVKLKVTSGRRNAGNGNHNKLIGVGLVVVLLYMVIVWILFFLM